MTKIERVETFILDLPTIRQHVLAMATMKTQSVVIVRVTASDGVVGWGEGATIGGLSYGEESVEGMALAIDTYMTPLLVGQDADRVAAAMTRIDAFVQGNNTAKCAVETALQDGVARRLGVPLAHLFGGRVRDRLACAWTLASGQSDLDIAEAERLLDARRHNIFKLKIGKRPLADDIAHIAAIKRALGDRASIRVDVNQAWSITDARRGLAALADAGADLVEQPVRRQHLPALARLTQDFPIAVMADEILRGADDAFRVAAAAGADVFSVKLAQSGGVGPAAKVAAIAEAAGIGIYGGTMIETGVGTAAAAQLFATLPRLEWGTELFGPLLFTDDFLVTPLRYENFALVVPDGPGIGVDIDPDRLDALRRDRPRSHHAVRAITQAGE
ncbi:muconate cycloisomerase (plasmid) [Azospirillum sp. B510]|uniref:muconate/chloromuconate family cycloisomerase n=1 Tax=Azospirillum sp. (strain B510) TaxID=137722 RepID=UPI0001C4B96C|nr:muconate/chloromuconate family cycloisomerase [Azospirillum sp. B510]BAI74214.1 muconate cycloisomerase [Azospirillum sp. B510]